MTWKLTIAGTYAAMIFMNTSQYADAGAGVAWAMIHLVVCMAAAHGLDNQGERP